MAEDHVIASRELCDEAPSMSRLGINHRLDPQDLPLNSYNTHTFACTRTISRDDVPMLPHNQRELSVCIGSTDHKNPAYHVLPILL